MNIFQKDLKVHTPGVISMKRRHFSKFVRYLSVFFFICKIYKICWKYTLQHNDDFHSSLHCGLFGNLSIYFWNGFQAQKIWIYFEMFSNILNTVKSFRKYSKLFLTVYYCFSSTKTVSFGKKRCFQNYLDSVESKKFRNPCGKVWGLRSSI